ncbi:acyl-CoA desaturase [bacterium]|nr:MAG: acyl-CoA desaturase [bacterium]
MFSLAASHSIRLPKTICGARSVISRRIIGSSRGLCGTILRWVIDHRRHHAHADQQGDVHSPYVDPWGMDHEGIRGFAYAHFGWMFDRTTTDSKVFGADLLADPVVMFFTRTHYFWLLISLGLPFSYGYVLGGWNAGVGSMLIGGCLRTTVLHNVVWAVNSVGHTHGTREFAQSNKSTNNLVLALLTLGDGWHNNHHRFPRSAHHGMRKGEVDVNGWIIDALEKFGFAREVIRIPQARLDAARKVNLIVDDCTSK